MDCGKTLLGAGLALLVAAAPVATCLATAHGTPAGEHAHSGCGDSSDAPSGALCADTGSVVATSAPTTPTPVDAVALPYRADEPAYDSGAPASGPPVPRARSAPIHLLHSTFLI